MNPLCSFFLAVLLSISIPLLTRGQQGFHYLTHYQHTFTNLDYQNRDIVQGADGMLYLANRRGIITFDGKHWEHILTEGSVYALAKSPKWSSRIFAAGKGTFGYAQRKKDGTFVYTSLSKSRYVGYDFRSLEVIGDKLYAFAEELLVEFDLREERELRTWRSEPEATLTGFFIHGNAPYLIWEERGVFKIDAENLAPVDFTLPEEDELAYYASTADTLQTILGTLNGKVFFFNGTSLSPLEFKETEYFRKSEPVDVVDLNDNYMAFATERGGCLLVDKTNGELREILNTQSGMPVNEMFAVGRDRTNGLWITHSYGYSRLDLRLPYRNFSYYGGLSGRITDLSWLKDRFFVSTTEGLFELSKVRNYRKVAYVVQQSIDPNEVLRRGRKTTESQQQVGNSMTKSKRASIIAPPTLKPDLKLDPETGELTEEGDEEEEELSRKERRQKRRQERRRKRLLRRLKKQQDEQPEFLDNDTDTEEDDEESDTKRSTTNPDSTALANEETSSTNNDSKRKRTARTKKKRVPSDQYQLRTKRELELQSVKYIYEQIEGMGEGSVDQLIRTPNSLIILHRDAVYELDEGGEKAKRIFNTKVDRLYQPPNSDGKRFYFIGRDKVGVLAHQGWRGWREEKTLEGFEGEITKLATDPQGRLWGIGYDLIYRLKFDEEEPRYEAHTIENRFDDEPIPIIKGDTLLFVLSEVTYFFDDSIARFVAADSTRLLKAKSSGSEISVNENLLWYKANSEWSIYGSYDYNPANAFLLNLLGEVKEIVPDRDNDYIWVVTRDNQLFHFQIGNRLELDYRYPMHFTQASDPRNGERFPLGDIVLEYSGNNLATVFRTPDFLSGDQLEYQYILLGNRRDAGWSEWRSDNTFDFSALDNGEYTLKVRSRNIFGEVVESPKVRIRVKPPYWQTSWFYAIEMGFFAFLVGITAFFNRRLTQESRWIILLRQTLTILTLIMCMEFLKVVLENLINITGSPVVDFGMEVAFALLIFPVERIFSHYVFRSDAYTNH